VGRDTFHQTRLLRAPSNLALNTARDRAATASLGSLGQGLTSLYYILGLCHIEGTVRWYGVNNRRVILILRHHVNP